jgi:hypothetical protein
VAPLHPPRDDARAFAARAGAAFAVFLAIAVVLLAGGSDGPLASAEATKGEPGASELAALAPQAEAPAAEPVVAEEPVLAEPPAAEPAEVEPAVEAPPTQQLAAPPVTGSAAGEHGPPAWSGGAKKDKDDKGEDQDEDEGDDDDDDGGPDPSGGSGNEQAPPRSGGDKGSEPGDDDGGGDDSEEPAPSGRPQVTAPAGQEPGSTPTQPATEPSAEDPAPGDGRGTLRDGGTRRLEGPSERPRRARFNTSAAGRGGSGGTPSSAAGDATDAGSAADGASAAAPATPGAGDGGQGSGGSGSGGDRGERPSPEDKGEPNIVEKTVTETVDRLVRVVPDSFKAALAALAALSVLLGIGYLLAALRARRLARQRRELLQEVGLLQTALLPPVPEKIGALRTTVAYRPADGPGAGGDFYDVLPLPGGRVGFILGDVSGHGRGALARTAFMRYTLRAYLEAGLEPRVALQVAGRVIDDNLGGDFATVLLAVHDPETGSLTYATAGHPAPIVVGPEPHEPVTAGSSPPIGVGVRTGLRQTTVPLVPGSVAALFTDGLIEARTEGGILGRERLAELLDGIGPEATARGLIEGVAAEANILSDDMAAVVVTPTVGVTAGLFRTEQLELSARELDGPIARRFLEACGLSEDEVDDAESDARQQAERFGGVILHVVFGNRLRVEVLPRNVESIESASRRVSAGSAL